MHPPDLSSIPALIPALLGSVVDYAGLFPPAKLDLRQAMANYEQYQKSPEHWLLGRFVLPLARLPEFTALLPAFPFHSGSLSGIVSSDWPTAIAQISSLINAPIAISALEFPPLAPTAIETVLSLLPAEVEAFFEIPLHSNLDDYLQVLQHPQSAAKLRTGGVTAADFPSRAQLGQVILALAKARVPFKATAGLHHALP
ncbi:MAG TPA: hypothetical protein V6C57_25990, partial [Coleofasciculaceae cyanobacterium]